MANPTFVDHNVIWLIAWVSENLFNTVKENHANFIFWYPLPKIQKTWSTFKI